MQGICSNSIEVLSSELWRELFDYFDGIELWYSFRNLNRKIDLIIDQTPLYFDFKKTGNYTFFTRHILPTVNIFNVRTLKLNQINQIQHFFSISSLDSMISLRQLSLNRMFSLNDNTFVFWNQLSCLKYLQTLKIKFLDRDGRGNSSEEIEFLIHSIFNKNFCPLLKSLIISTNRAENSIRTMSSLSQTTQPTNIEYFWIDELVFSDLLKLFPALQNLKSLYVNCDFDFEKISNEHLENFSISIPMLSKCVRMSLYLEDSTTFEQIKYLLKHTPNLKDLSLWNYRYHLLVAKEWESILSFHCLNLIKFDLRCVGHDDDLIYEQIAKRFEKRTRKRSFWIERNAICGQEAFANEDYYHTVIQFNTKKRQRRLR